MVKHVFWTITLHWCICPGIQSHSCIHSIHWKPEIKRQFFALRAITIRATQLDQTSIHLSCIYSLRDRITRVLFAVVNASYSMPRWDWFIRVEILYIHCAPAPLADNRWKTNRIRSDDCPPIGWARDRWNYAPQALMLLRCWALSSWATRLDRGGRQGGDSYISGSKSDGVVSPKEANLSFVGAGK